MFKTVEAVGQLLLPLPLVQKIDLLSELGGTSLDSRTDEG